MWRATILLSVWLAATGASAGPAGAPCQIAHYDGAGLIEGQPEGPLDHFGAGVTVRGMRTSSGTPYFDLEPEVALYDFQVFTAGTIDPFPPVINARAQPHNLFGFVATDSDDGAMVSNVFGGTIVPPADLGHGAVYALIASESALPPPIQAPFPYVFQFGASLARMDSLLLIGASGTTIDGMLERGAAYAYALDGDNWVLETELLGPGTNQFDHVGDSVALSANGLALIGGTGVNGNGFNSNGAVFAFHRTPEGQWIYEEKLIEPFGQIGSIWFGYSVAMSKEGSTAVITAPNADTQDGAAYVYNRVGQQWVFIEKIIPSNPVGSFAMYGNDVALSEDGSFLAVADSEDSQAGFSAGALYVYRRNPNTGLYEEIAKLLPPDPFPDDDFGASIDIDGDLLVAGQLVDYDDGGVGGIYVYAGVLGLDCNGNGAPDACDISAGTSQDLDGNGIPDECQVPGDLDADGDVDLADHAAFIACLTGPNGGVPTGCASADLQNDADVDLADAAGFQIVFTGP